MSKGSFALGEESNSIVFFFMSHYFLFLPRNLPKGKNISAKIFPK
jgi:hypothetical protein